MIKKIPSFFLVVTVLSALLSVGYALASVYTFPQADGDYRQWQTSSGSRGGHHVLVDESRCDPNDYVYTTNHGMKDSYHVDLSGIPDYNFITKIEILACAERIDYYDLSTMFLGAFYIFEGIEDGIQEIELPWHSITTTFYTNIGPYVWDNLDHIKTPYSDLQVGVVYTEGQNGVKVNNIRSRITYQYGNLE
ncbi:MAG: hypothetical protein ABIH87_00405 [bacterium]